MIYLPHRVSGGIVESACATCGSTRLVRSCAFDRMIDEEIKNRSNDPQLPDIGIRSGTACCGAGQSVRTVRISSRYSVGAGISAGVSIAREASRRTCALAAPHAIPAPDHPTSPADRRPKRYRRHRHSSGRHSPNRSLVPRGRNLRTPPAPHSAPETNTARKHRRGTVPQPPDAAGTHSPPRNEHCPKTQTQHRPVAPERRLSPIRPPKRTPPENTEAAPSRNLRTPPAPHSAPETNTARKHRGGTVPQPPDDAGTLFGPRNEHRPKTQRRHRSAAPPKKTQSSLPEQVPAGMTLIRRDVGRHHGTTG